MVEGGNGCAYGILSEAAGAADSFVLAAYAAIVCYWVDMYLQGSVDICLLALLRVHPATLLIDHILHCIVHEAATAAHAASLTVAGIMLFLDAVDQILFRELDEIAAFFRVRPLDRDDGRESPARATRTLIAIRSGLNDSRRRRRRLLLGNARRVRAGRGGEMRWYPLGSAPG